VAKAVIGHIVPAAHRLIDGRTGGADAAAALVHWFVGDALRAGAAAQRQARMVSTTGTGMKSQQLQVQSTGILKPDGL
jgi:hypothetical protein